MISENGCLQLINAIEMPSILVSFSSGNFKFAAANNAWLIFFGLTKKEFSGFGISDLNKIYNKYFESFDDFFIDSIDIKNPEEQIPLQLTSKTGLNYKLTHRLIDADEHNIRYFLHSIALTPSRLVHEKVLDTLVMEGLEMIAVLDVQGNYLKVSSSVKGILGFSQKNFLSANAFEFIHPDDVPRIKEQFSKAQHVEKMLLKPYRFKNVKGEYLWVETIISNKLTDPNIQGLVANSRDITERMYDRIKAEISNERYKYAVKATSDAIWDWDIQKGTLIWGENFRILFGYNEQDLNSDIHSWIEKIHPEDIEQFSRKLDKVILTEETVWSAEYRFLKANGEYAIVHDKGFLIRDELGKALRMVGAMHDVTSKKVEEQRIRLLESVVLNTTDSVVITQIDTSSSKPISKIIYVNNAFTLMTGYSAEDVVGKSPRILEGPKTDQLEIDRIIRCLLEGHSCDTNMVNYKKNGDEFWNSFSVTPVENEKGEFDIWISIQRDITKEKISENRKKLFNDISGVFNSNSGLRDVLTLVLKIINKNTGFDASEIWLPDTYKRNLKLFAKTAENEKAIQFHYDTKNIVKIPKGESLAGKVWETMDLQVLDDFVEFGDFSRRHAAQKAGLKTAIGLPLNHNGTFIGVLILIGNVLPDSISFDIIGEELARILGAEIKRKQLENELDKIFNFAPDIIAVLNFKGYFRKINLAACELLGYSDNELLSEPTTHFVHPDDREKTLEAIKIAMDEDISHFENRCLTKSGKTIWLSWTATYVPEESSIFIVGKDITERKNLEDLLFKSNNLAIIGSWEIDPEAQKIYCSEIACEIIEAKDGFKPDLLLISRFFGSKNNHLNKGKIVLEDLENWDEEIQIKAFSGKLKWIRSIGQTEIIDGKFIRAYGSIQDINSRKVAEANIAEANKELEESEKRYHELFHLSPLPMWVYDFESLNFLDVNRAAVNNYGYSRDEFLKMNIRNIRPEEELGVLEKTLKDNVKHNLVYKGTYKHRTKKGDLIYVDIKTNHIVFSGRKAKLVVATDISERLDYINTIEKQNEKLKEIAWIQSHTVRAPLARIMALIDMLNNSSIQKKLTKDEIIQHIENSAKELDTIIRAITIKSDASQQ
ncbi:PAS domain S-box protein [Pedobacter mendelii]|uniref:histidine kinase n=1 Tax=Pedobacter mendelii TaxID=1908240 RepID=A0ABQ2BL72_9SPHI|nr:PAS domain S-box protein [Pedobacter mendelii]GGI27211.1 hypothetical protein GCM10008119_26520 [Pedobacter mendelii]